MKKSYKLFLIIAILFFTACASATGKEIFKQECSLPTVPVYGFAQAFVGDAAVSNAKVTILETGKSFMTNRQGQFSFCALPHQQITLTLTKKSIFPWNNYKTTQTGTFIVPTNGMKNKFEQVTFQVPRKLTFDLLSDILSSEHHIKFAKNQCNVATTVTAFNKTLVDDLQGEPGAKLLLWHDKKRIDNPQVIYFGILHGKTNPFNTSLQFTSTDGGAIIYNLKSSDKLYYLSAIKKGKLFSTEIFLCQPGAFINLSPPHGPRVLKNNYETIPN